MINRDIDIASFKKVGSWQEKSGELLKKRARVILSTLLLTLISIKLEGLISVLGYKSKDRYRDDYIMPLKANKLFTYTIPEKANDPNQAYIITERGKSFLVGNPI
ncbi:MAG: hypothetical protein DRJ05_17060 [Bacteroidetes bacterium]|nr:MAG: hypothetical protein DRJ05_17060 [Bacteroidota bacterium]